MLIFPKETRLESLGSNTRIAMLSASTPSSSISRAPLSFRQPYPPRAAPLGCSPERNTWNRWVLLATGTSLYLRGGTGVRGRWWAWSSASRRQLPAPCQQLRSYLTRYEDWWGNCCQGEADEHLNTAEWWRQASCPRNYHQAKTI